MMGSAGRGDAGKSWIIGASRISNPSTQGEIGPIRLSMEWNGAWVCKGGLVMLSGELIAERVPTYDLPACRNPGGTLKVRRENT